MVLLADRWAARRPPLPGARRLPCGHARYPDALRDDLVEDLHGHAVADPYRWLEDADVAARRRAWRRRRTRSAREHLDAPARPRAAARAAAALLAPAPPACPPGAADRAFSTRRAARARSTPCCSCASRTAASGCCSTSTALDPVGHDHAGRLGAAARRAGCWPTRCPRGGDEESLLHVLDVDTGELVDGPVDRCRYSPVAWEPGGAAFFYVRRLAPDLVPAGEEQFHRRVYRHVVGTAAGAGRRACGATGLDPTNYYGCSVSLRRPLAGGQRERRHRPARRRLAVRPRAGGPPARGAGRASTRAARPGSAATAACGCSPTATPRAAGSASPTRSGPQDWTELVPEDPEAVLEDVELLADGRLVVLRSRHAVSELAVRGTDGAEVPVALPGLGTVAGLSGQPEGGEEVWLGWTDATTPPRRAPLDAAPATSRCGPTPRARSTCRPCARLLEVAVRPTARPSGCRCCRPTAEPRPAAPDRALRLRRLRRRPHARLHRRARWPGSRPAAPGWWPTCAAAARRARTGTAPGCASTSRTSSTTSRPCADALVARGLDDAGAARDSTAAATAACSSAPRSPSARTLYAAVVCSRAAARHGPLRAVRPRPHLERRVRHGRRPGRAGLAAGYSPYHRVARAPRYPAVLFTVFDGDTRVDPLHARKLCAALQHATASRPRPCCCATSATSATAPARSAARSASRSTCSPSSRPTPGSTSRRRPEPCRGRMGPCPSPCSSPARPATSAAGSCPRLLADGPPGPVPDPQPGRLRDVPVGRRRRGRRRPTRSTRDASARRMDGVDVAYYLVHSHRHRADVRGRRPPRGRSTFAAAAREAGRRPDRLPRRPGARRTRSSRPHLRSRGRGRPDPARLRRADGRAAGAA